MSRHISSPQQEPINIIMYHTWPRIYTIEHLFLFYISPTHPETSNSPICNPQKWLHASILYRPPPAKELLQISPQIYNVSLVWMRGRGRVSCAFCVRLSVNSPPVPKKWWIISICQIKTFRLLDAVMWCGDGGIARPVCVKPKVERERERCVWVRNVCGSPHIPTSDVGKWTLSLDRKK